MLDLVCRFKKHMAFPKRFVIEEDLTTLRKALQCSRNEMTRKRLRTLIIYKQHEEEGISKNQVAARTGIDPASALKWRNAYIEGGLSERATGTGRSVPINGKHFEPSCMTRRMGYAGTPNCWSGSTASSERS
jgi:hypothetical protein